MAEKSYANDPAKERSRQLLKTTIEDTLLKFMRPQDIRVVHLPGPDGMEYKQVYGHLGIPPENVEGVEQDPRSAEFARRNNPGLKIHNTTLEQFVADNPRMYYHVGSIDYSGNASAESLDTAMILGQKIRSNNLVYHLAMQKRRENSKTMAYLENMAGTIRFNSTLMSGRETTVEEPSDAQGLREFGMTYVLLAIQEQTNRERVPGIYAALLGHRYSEMIQTIVRKIDERHADLEFGKKFGERLSCDPLNLKLGTYTDIFLHYLNLLTFNLIAISVHKQLSSALGLSTVQLQEGSMAVAKALIQSSVYPSSGQTRVITDLVRYSYVSESGAPMIGDIAYLRTNTALHQMYLDFPSNFEPGTFVIRDRQKLARAMTRLARASEKTRFHQNKDLFIDRIYLGSSARPILRREQAIELIKQGHSTEELATRFRGISRRRLGAYAAHITMGTYDNEKDVPEIEAETQKELQQDIETRVLLAAEGAKVNGGEILSKQDAVEYLRAGIPRQEIHTAYPGTSMPQLVAWEFWLKKGKY